MTYHDEPYYECNWCGARVSTEDIWKWSNPSYDTHYCPKCTKEIEENE